MKTTNRSVPRGVFVGAIALLVACVFTASSCKKGPSAGGGGPGPQKSTGEIRVGAILPLTGDIAEYGKRCKDGMDLAVEEINSQGGAGRPSVSVLYEDDQGVPASGVNAATKLISSDKVNAIVGAVASSVTLAIVPITDKNQVVLFSPASSSPKLSGISKYFFRNWPSDVFEASALAEFAFNELKIKSVAILYVNNEYGIGLQTEFERRFKELGGDIPDIAAYAQASSDFRPYITKALGGHPGAIYLAGYHVDMAKATKQLRQLGFKGQILGDADYGVEELVKIAGKAAEGAIFAAPGYDPGKGDAAMKAFAEKFKTKYNRDPSQFEANAYDALKLIVEAGRSEGFNGDGIAKWLATVKDYPGAAGKTTILSNGDVVRPTQIRMVKKQQFVDYGQ